MIARRKYKQIYDDILRLIQNGTLKPGDRLPSEQTLAENYGVCRDTIRKALIALKDAGYSQSVRGGGTYIRFSDREKREEIVSPKRRTGIILPDENGFLKEAYKAIVQTAEENGYSCEIQRNTDIETEKKCIQYFLDSRVDGIIISPLRNPYEIENANLLEQGQIPYVFIGDPIPEVFCDCVYFNDFYDAYLAVQEFYRHNYDTVIHITDSVCERISVRNRKEGFMKGMQQFFPNSNIIVVDMAQPSGVSRLKNLLDNDVRIGFFLYDDLLYPRIRPLLLKSRKKLMRDIGVLGYNDLDICNEFPEKLSSIHLPRYELGKRSFELLDQHLNFNISMEVSHILLKSNIIFRGTF